MATAKNIRPFFEGTCTPLAFTEEMESVAGWKTVI